MKKTRLLLLILGVSVLTVSITSAFYSAQISKKEKNAYESGFVNGRNDLLDNAIIRDGKGTKGHYYLEINDEVYSYWYE